MVGIQAKDSAGGTPTDAVETTALPEKPLMIGALKQIYPDDIDIYLYPGKIRA